MRKFDDIIPPSRRRETEPLVNSIKQPSTPSTEKPFKFPAATFVVIVLVIIVSVIALFYFSSARVEVIPNTVSVAVQGSFTAQQSAGELPYELLTAQKIASQSVKSSGTKVVHSFASGPITIYNTQAKAQKLIATTRFATTAGLIFRIKTAVTIPAGTVEKPGSIIVTVTADKEGDVYNVAPTSFTVPGLAGTPQASQVYARSNTAMTGGASGSVPVIDAVTENQTREALIKALDPDLMASLEAKVPSDYVLLPGSATTTYQELSSAPSNTTGMVEIKEQGTITAIVFPNAALAKSIAGSVGGRGYQNEPVTLASVDSLTFSAPNGMPVLDAKSFSFSLSGTASLIYTVDPTRIAAAVSGETRSAAEVALTNYPEVKRAVIILRPFWKKTFPEDPSSILVVVVPPQQ